MSELKWTPGPWSISEDAWLVNGIDSRERFKGSPSLDIYDAEEWPLELMDEAKANAHLISAAPELYDALFDLVEKIKAQQSEHKPFLRAAEGALAKARGEP